MDPSKRTMASTRIAAVVILTLLFGSVESIYVSNTSSTRTATGIDTGASAGNQNSPFTATTGTGSAYASACASAYSYYTSQSLSYRAHNASTGTDTSYAGGTSYQRIIYYANATTLCDGHPRLTTSPAVPLSTAWSTMAGSASATVLEPYTIYYLPKNLTFPSCRINPDDCDPLWTSYDSALSAWATPTAGGKSQITASPLTPPCMNVTAASSYSSATASIFGCGVCTIYGNDVQLLYFPEPTTVSRDLCASTPTASLTHYGTDAVITAFAGMATGNSSYPARVNRNASEVYAVLNGHTLASGTAYISIRSVWAVDRCSSQIGTTVTDAILAMPSESVLSLRYSQNHFQAFGSTDVQTGYPVSYADFNNPIPWSAWNGQAICGGSTWGLGCDVIYENQFRPQLAIPPGIKMLDPKWQNCQMWYGGLYDPPMALSRTTLDAPSAIGYNSPPTAAPSVAATPTTATQTANALADNLPSTAAPYAQPAQTGTATQPNGDAGNDNGQQGQGSSVQAGNGAQDADAQSSDYASSGQTQSGVAQAGTPGSSDTGVSGSADSGGSDSGVSGGSGSGGSGASNSGGSGAGISGAADSDGSGPGVSGGANSGGSGSATGGSGAADSGASGLGGSGGSDSAVSAGSGSGVTGGSGSGASGAANSGGSGSEESSAANSGGSGSGSGSGSAGSGAANSGGSGSGVSGAADSGSSNTGSNSGVSNGADSNNIGAAQQRVFAVNGQTFTADATRNVVLVGSRTLTLGAPAQTLSGGVAASYGTNGLVVRSSSAISLPRLASNTNGANTASTSGTTTVVTIVNQIVTVSQCSPNGALAIGSTTLLPGGAPATLPDGLVVSDVDGSLDWSWASTVAINANAASSSRGLSGYASPTDQGDEVQTSSTSIRANSAASGVSHISNTNGIAPTQNSAQSSNASRTYYSRFDVLLMILACIISVLVI